MRFLLFLILTCLILASCQEKQQLVNSQLYIDPCPSSYVYIARRYDLNTEPFCISRDLMAYSGGKLTVRKNNLSAVTTTHDSAEALCQGLGSRYDLVSLAQYQVAAQEVELRDENWSAGAIGNGWLAYTGAPVTVMSGETLDGVGDNVRAALTDAYKSWTKEYFFSYSTVGYTFDSKAGLWFTQSYPLVVANFPYENASTWFAPMGDYSAAYGMDGGLDDAGLGIITLDSGPGYIIRGAFAMKPFNAEFAGPAYSDSSVGFHCVYLPED